jgi:hypothetical protein
LRRPPHPVIPIKACCRQVFHLTENECHKRSGFTEEASNPRTISSLIYADLSKFALSTEAGRKGEETGYGGYGGK